MKAVDPSIRLLAVGDNDMKWNRTVLRESGKNIDYLVIHHYNGTAEMKGDPLNLMARPLHYEKFYVDLRKMVREFVPGRDIRLAINEWNTSLPVPRQHSMESALYGARLMNVFERSDIVALSAPSDMVNGWPGGLIQASRYGAFVTPIYLATVLYSTHLGTDCLATRVESPTFDSTREGTGIPYLDVVVSRSADRKQIFIKAVNTDVARAMRTTIQFAGTTISPQGILQTLTGENMTVANSFEMPNAVSIHQTTPRGGDVHGPSAEALGIRYHVECRRERHGRKRKLMLKVAATLVGGAAHRISYPPSIGGLFTKLGIVLAIYKLISHKSLYQRSLSIVMALFGCRSLSADLGTT